MNPSLLVFLHPLTQDTKLSVNSPQNSDNILSQRWLLSHTGKNMYIYSFVSIVLYYFFPSQMGRKEYRHKVTLPPYYNVSQSSPVLQWIPSPELKKVLLLKLLLWTWGSAALFFFSFYYWIKYFAAYSKALQGFLMKESYKSVFEMLHLYAKQLYYNGKTTGYELEFIKLSYVE